MGLPGPPGCTNPLKTTVSSRRASTLAARRNIASTLVISGSAICAPRTRTLTCSVASCRIFLSSMNIWSGGGRNAAGAAWYWMRSLRTKSVSPGSGPINGRKVAATRARLASS